LNRLDGDTPSSKPTASLAVRLLRGLQFLIVAGVLTASPALAQIQVGADIDGEAAGDQAGWSVAMSSDGNTVVIGALLSDGAGSNSGHARVYGWDGAAWVQVGADIDGEAANDQSGYSVAMSSDGSTVIVGAPGNDGTGTAAGHARVYGWDGAAWVRVGADLDGEAFFDQAGSSVAMSSDGSTVVIGAPHSDGNGASAGHARVYHWTGAVWVQVGADLDGEAALDQAGRSVAMSSDGSTVVIGAHGNDGNGPDAGHARVYQWTGAAWVQV